MMMRGFFADVAARFSAAMDGPFHDAVVHDRADVVLDAGGSIAVPAVSQQRPCQVQVDTVDEAMRAEAGYAERDAMLIVLGLEQLDTDARLEVMDGPDAGRWSVQSVRTDPAGVGLVCRGRRWAG
jgi:hypothetical protein